MSRVGTPPHPHPHHQIHGTWDTMGYDQQAGNRHPTGMRSCLLMSTNFPVQHYILNLGKFSKKTPIFKLNVCAYLKCRTVKLVYSGNSSVISHLKW